MCIEYMCIEYTVILTGMFKGSTEHVLNEALPQLIELDGIMLPDMLNFDVPQVHASMMKKAINMVRNDTIAKDNVFAEKVDGKLVFWVLSATRCGIEYGILRLIRIRSLEFTV